MQHGSARARLESLGLIDEQLYAAYRRAQRTTREDEQKDIAAEIQAIQQQRSALLNGLLSASPHH